jgi:hypothetical protein
MDTHTHESGGPSREADKSEGTKPIREWGPSRGTVVRPRVPGSRVGWKLRGGGVFGVGAMTFDETNPIWATEGHAGTRIGG